MTVWIITAIYLLGVAAGTFLFMLSAHEGSETKAKDVALGGTMIVFWPLMVGAGLVYSAGRIWFHRPPK